MGSNDQPNNENELNCYKHFYKDFESQFTNFYEEYIKEGESSVHVKFFDKDNVCSQALKTFFSDLLSTQAQKLEKGSNRGNEDCHLFILPVLMLCYDKDIKKQWKKPRAAFWKLNFYKELADRKSAFTELNWKTYKEEEDGSNSPYDKVVKDFYTGSWKKDEIESHFVQTIKDGENVKDKEDGTTERGWFSSLFLGKKGHLKDFDMDGNQFNAFLEKIGIYKNAGNSVDVIKTDVCKIGIVEDYIEPSLNKFLDMNFGQMDIIDKDKYCCFRYPLKTMVNGNDIEVEFVVVYYLCDIKIIGYGDTCKIKVLCNNIEKNNIRNSIEHLFKRLFNIGLFLENFVLFKKGKFEKEKAQQSEKMLSLMKAPLERISDALLKTQKDAQELSAILYSPSRSIFSAQSVLALLFDENRVINNPNGSVSRVAHQPEDLDDRDAGWLFAHALSRFRGMELKGVSMEDALAREVYHIGTAVANIENPYHRFAKAILHLLNVNSGDMNAIMGLASSSNAKEKMGLIKERLFSPFKPEEAKNKIPLQVFLALIPEVKFKDLDCIDNKVQPIIADGSNPFATQGHLLEFFSSFFSQIPINELKNISVNWQCFEKGKDIETIFTLENLKDYWIKNDLNDFVSFFNKRVELRQQSIYEEGEYGNFHKPFVDLIRRHPIPDILEETEVNDKGGICLVLNKKLLQFSFNKNKFTLSSKSPLLFED